ncbi:gliding motility-associated C-terminal domain-containing protein [Myroides sp. LJL119]
MINYKTLLLLAGISGFTAFGQDTGSTSAPLANNKGQLYISPNGVLSTKYDFVNKQGGDFRNNGEFHVYQNLENQGEFFDYKGELPQGVTIFKGNKLQHISGDYMKFNDIVFDNTTDKEAFKILSDIDIQGAAEFKDGIVVVKQETGSITFLHGSKVNYVHDEGHVKGRVDKQGSNTFTYPFGDVFLNEVTGEQNNFHRPAMIAAETQGKYTDLFSGYYGAADAKEVFATKDNTEGIIKDIDNKEYWIIESSKDTQTNIILSLTWDDRITPAEFIPKSNDDREFAILRWDPNLQIWLNEGGIVDLANKTITTPTKVRGYGYFTLGVVEVEDIIEGGVVIYNLVSPNDGSNNDYFRIEHLEHYPNNRVEIFNRWGSKVYETSNYNSNGNVFRGYSDGKITVDKDAKLPTGTYYYVITYQYQKDGVMKNVKKAGYLHLENN